MKKNGEKELYQIWICKFPGGLVVRIQHSHSHDLGLIPGQGNTYLVFPHGSDGKEAACNAGDQVQSWWATVHGVT